MTRKLLTVAGKSCIEDLAYYLFPPTSGRAATQKLSTCELVTRQLLQLVLSLVAGLCDFGALNLVLNLVLAGSSFSLSLPKSIVKHFAVQQTHHRAGLPDAVFGEQDLGTVVRERDSREQPWTGILRRASAPPASRMRRLGYLVVRS